MIHCLTTAATHNAPVNEVKAPKLQGISREDPIPCGCQTKKETCWGALTFQIPFRGKPMEEES